jgi:hypothetical protein
VIMGRFMLHHLNSVYREFSGDLARVYRLFKATI